MNWYKQSGIDSPDGIKPWEMTSDEFLIHHYTGGIADDFYKEISQEKSPWKRINNENYVHHHDFTGKDGREYVIMRDDEPSKYIKHVPVKLKNIHGYEYETTEHARDENDDLIYYTDEENLAEGRAIRENTLHVFHNDMPIGDASNEWGSTGVWVNKEHQNNGLGTYLIEEIRKLHPNLKKLGQMTSAGVKLTKAYHRKLVKDAIMRGDNVPQKVKDEYGL